MVDEKHQNIVDEWWQYESASIRWKYQTIPEGREIIGVYGNKSKSPYSFKQLGFILWKPNPLAD